jgi:hypothetical protein
LCSALLNKTHLLQGYNGRSVTLCKVKIKYFVFFHLPYNGGSMVESKKQVFLMNVKVNWTVLYACRVLFKSTHAYTKSVFHACCIWHISQLLFSKPLPVWLGRKRKYNSYAKASNHLHNTAINTFTFSLSDT